MCPPLPRSHNLNATLYTPRMHTTGKSRYLTRFFCVFKFNFQGIYYGERWAKSVLPVTGRDAVLQLDGSYVYKMKSFVDVNLRTTYTYNERLSAYLQFNNILAQRYAIYSGIPTQRFFAALGASYSF